MSTSDKVRFSFHTQAAVIDSLIHSPEIAAKAAVADVVIKIIKSDIHLRDYFFRNRPSVAWLPKLWENGFFDEPPPPVPSAHGPLVAAWDAQQYLISIAADAPEDLLKHIETLDAPGYYIERAVASLLQLLPDRIDIAEKALPRVIGLMNEIEMANALRFTVENLLVALVRLERPVAFGLFSSFIRPFSSRIPGDEEQPYKRTEAQSVVDSYKWRGDEEFKSILKALEHSDLCRMIEIYENALLQALDLEKSEQEREQNFLLPSSWWRSAIEQSSQNFHHYYKDELIDVLRDACEKLIKIQPKLPEARALVEKYLNTARHLNTSSDGFLLRRLGLHLVRTHPAHFPDLLVRELCLAANYDDTTINHEFLELLKDGFPYLTEDEKKRVLVIVENGPPEERVQDLARRISGRRTEEEIAASAIVDDAEVKQEVSAEQYEREYIQHWKLERLWMIREHLTGRPEEARIAELVASQGEPNHPSFNIWHSGVFSISDVSPLSESEIDELAPPDILDYLRTWTPPSERSLSPERISREGLASIVAPKIVSQLVELGATYVAELCALHPDYAYAILSRLTNAADGTEGLDEQHWNACVRICSTLLASKEIREGMQQAEHFRWRDVRMKIVDLVHTGLNRDENPIPMDLLSDVGDILTVLTSDPDPDLESDRPGEGWVGHNDPHHVAINHVRPKALDTFIVYTWDVGKRNNSFPVDDVPARHIAAPFRSVLEHCLKDSALSVHSIYGRRLGLLFWMDREWVHSHLPEIFPDGTNEEARDKFLVAWEGYVIFSRMLYADLCAELYGHYVKSLEIAAQGRKTKTHLGPVDGLVSHLVFFYYREQPAENFTEHDHTEKLAALLPDFFRSVPGEARGQAAWQIWKKCKDKIGEGSNLNDWWSRTRELWEERVKRAASQNYPSDFDIEMGWFSRILELLPEGTENLVSLWPLLQGLIPYVETSGFRHDVWDSLEKLIDEQMSSEPVHGIDLYTQMFEQTERLPNAWREPDATRRILEKGAKNPESRDATLALLDSIARRGDRRFTDIFIGNAI